MAHTPGPVLYSCQKCKWTGWVNGKPRCLPCYAAATRKWRAEHPDADKALKRRMEKTPAGRARVTRHKRERRARNPEAVRAAWQRRVEWLATGYVTKQELQDIYAANHGCCTYCNTVVPNPRFDPRDPRGFDHVVSRNRGGQHTAANIVVCCRSCNERKSDGIAV